MADTGLNSFWDLVGGLTGGIVGPLISIVAGWDTWFKGLVGFLGGASASLFWTLIGRHVLCWIQWYFCWLLRMLYSSLLTPLGKVLKWMPAVPPLVVDPMVNSWKIINYWAPLNECLAGICIVFLIIWGFRWFRFIKQFFPTASN